MNVWVYFILEVTVYTLSIIYTHLTHLVFDVDQISLKSMILLAKFQRALLRYVLLILT